MTVTSSHSSKVKRKSPQRTIDLRAKIAELSKAGKTPTEIAKITGKSRAMMYEHLRTLQASGEDVNYTYNRLLPVEERRWYKIIETVNEQLPFYAKMGLIPTARKMGYRLIELAANAKAENPNITTDELELKLGLPDLKSTDVNSPIYKENKAKFFDLFYSRTADARKGVKSDYKTPTTLPKLPIDCFVDEKRTTIGNTDMDKPIDPTPDEAPDDPIETAKDAIQECKDAILNYDGSCTKGEEGIKPGGWYKQPIYCEIACESDTIQKDLEKYQHDKEHGYRHVKVSSMKGFKSTGFMHGICTRLKQVVEDYDWIKEIRILYFGDSDKHGNYIRTNIENALNWYQGDSEDLKLPVPVKLVHVAITPDQIKKYRLTGAQLEAFMTTKQRLKIFKQILLDAIDDCWDENIYNDNCPDEEYDYEANDMEEPEDLDPDNEYFDNTEITIRDKMIQMATDAFKEGWENEFKNSKDKNNSNNKNE